MKVYFALDENKRIEAWGTSPSSPDDIERDLPLDHEILQSYGLYAMNEEGEFVKDNEFLLNSVRATKMKELSMKCQEAILGYFEATVNSVVFLFSFDYEAQSNFTGSLSLFTKGLVTHMEWTVHRDGVTERVVLNEMQFLQVVAAGFGHKNAKISKLRNELQPLVFAATTVEEIEAIHWE